MKHICKTPWCIQDWAGNKKDVYFKTFDEAEEYLSEMLGDNYDTDRDEWNIVNLLTESY